MHRFRGHSQMDHAPVTLNSGYVLPLCTMLKSLSYSNEGTDIDLYIVHSSLTLADFQKINAVTINTDISLHPIKVDNSLFDGAPTCKRISKETYYRIFASELLPKELDRILYIDPDTVVINRLDDFYNADFGSNVLIGAKHFDGAMKNGLPSAGGHHRHECGDFHCAARAERCVERSARNHA